MANSEQIGVYVLESPKVFTNHYETAAWYQNVEVPAGEYPIFGNVKMTDLTPKMHPGILDTWVTGKMDGTVVGSDFSALFGGQRVSSNINSDVGQNGQHGIQSYAYSAADSILNDEVTAYKLTNAFHARYDYNVQDDGTVRKSAHIYKVADDIVWLVQGQFTPEHYPDYHILYARKLDGERAVYMAYNQRKEFVVAIHNCQTQTLIEVIDRKTFVDRDTFWAIRPAFLDVK